jgi:hypothetical protein
MVALLAKDMFLSFTQSEGGATRLLSCLGVLWWNRHPLPALGYFFNILYPVAANDAIIVESLVGSRNWL